MCGIAGIVNLGEQEPPCLDQGLRMIGSLRHRGPDEFGAYQDARAVLGHARLSIIDLVSGQQPLSNERGNLWIVFNGEIFNYLELRRELEAAGHRFNTQSDTEVIVHAYEQWGEAAFRRFNGQWAVALWDHDTGSLVLARDPYGVRPLYWCEHDGRLIFASEVKAIFAAAPTIPRRFDPAGFEQVLTFWTTVAPRTVFLGVRELEPGVVRTITGRGVRQVRSFDPSYPAGEGDGFRGSVEDATVAAREALEKATGLRMLRSDVPVGSYLSGGLDSSLVAALGLRAKGGPFATFSLRFADAEYDETAYQRLMARRLGTTHHEVLVTRADIARAFPDVIAHAERPVLRTAPAPLFLLSRLVHETGIKVVLTGEGADEMFGGYDLFREAKVRRFWANDPTSSRRPRLLQRLYPYLARSPVTSDSLSRQFFGQGLERWREPGFGHDPRWRGTAALKRLLQPDFRAGAEAGDARQALLDDLPAGFQRWSSLAQDQYLEIRTLLSGYLLSSQGDRMLMAHSVEGRFPYLDREVAALADSLPAAYKLRVLDEKHVLKRAAADLVPEEIVRRKKQPYRAPDALAFATREGAEWIDRVATDARLDEAGVFQAAPVRGLIAKCRAHAASGQFSNADNMALSAVLSTQLLHDALLVGRTESRAGVALTTFIDRVTSPTGAPA